jgi:hypothetical protein
MICIVDISRGLLENEYYNIGPSDRMTACDDDGCIPWDVDGFAKIDMASRHLSTYRKIKSSPDTAENIGRVPPEPFAAGNCNVHFRENVVRISEILPGQ